MHGAAACRSAGRPVAYYDEFENTVERTELPGLDVAVVIGFGDPLRGVTHNAMHTAIAGLRDTPLVTRHAGRQAGVAVRLDPLSAYRLTAVPMHLLSRRLVELDHVLGRDAGDLREQLRDISRRTTRIEYVRRVFAARIAEGPLVDPAVTRAWRRLTSGRRVTSIQALAETVGCSTRQLERRFRQQVGLAPRTVARISRFNQAMRMLPDSGRRLVDVAAAAGYSDQAHLCREVQALAGCSPTALAHRPGTLVTDVASVQDPPGR